MNKIFTMTALALGLLLQAERFFASAFRATLVTMELTQIPQNLGFSEACA